VRATLELPPAIATLVDALAGARGAVAVALGGSRATGDADAASDWDVALYYRGALDTEPLARFGEVHPPGSWGRIMNGGAWLELGGAKIDVLLRDLDVVEPWCERARRGEYEVDALLGYLAGVPTYLLLAERATGALLRGTLAPVGPFPVPLAAAAERRWRFHRDFALEQAAMRAAREDVVGAAGQVAQAILCEAHARLAARREWVLNEKRMVERAGLAATHALLRDVPRAARELAAWVDRAAAALPG